MRKFLQIKNLQIFTQSQYSASQDDDAVAESEEGRVTRMKICVFLDHQRHQRRWTDCHRRNAAEEDVDEGAHEGRVHAILKV